MLGVCQIMTVMAKVDLPGNTQPETERHGTSYCMQEQCIPILQT